MAKGIRYSDHIKNQVMSDHNSGLLTVQQLSNKFNVSRPTLYRWIKENKKNKTFSESELEFLQSQLTFINTMLMRTEITEQHLTILPSFSLTSIYPNWIDLYKFPLRTLELLSIRYQVHIFYGEYKKEYLEEHLTQMKQNPNQFIEEINQEEEVLRKSPPSQQAINEFVDEINSSEDEATKEWITASTMLLNISIAMLYNYLSIMIHNKSIHELLYSYGKPSRNDIKKAVRVDKSLLGHELVKKEIANRQLDGSTEFFDSLGRAISSPSFKGRRSYPRAYLALNLLEREGKLIDGKFIGISPERAFKLIHQAGFFLPKNGPATVYKFMEKIVKPYFEQK